MAINKKTTRHGLAGWFSNEIKQQLTVLCQLASGVIPDKELETNFWVYVV
jgi:hypothetical protein